MKIKSTRELVGVVGKVSLPCGCYALVAQGKAVLQSGVKHAVTYVCADWKKHKYALAEAERDLARRMIAARGVRV